MARTERPGPVLRTLAAAAAVALGVVLTVAVMDLPSEPAPLAGDVGGRAAETGADNPVTAVLLGFRAHDTWLELAVVLAASAGVLAVARSGDLTRSAPRPADPLLAYMTALVVPAAVVVGGVLLWRGTSGPGGAFQAGSVLGAAILLLWLSGWRSITALPARALAAALVVGVAAFLLAAVAPVAAGDPPLRLPSEAATALVLAVEAAVTVAVAASLALMVLGARAVDRPSRPRGSRDRGGERP